MYHAVKASTQLRAPFQSQWRLQNQWSRLRSLTSVSKQSPKQPNPSIAAMPLRDMPGPPVLANLARYTREGFRNHHTVIEKLFEQYGPTFQFAMPGKKVVYVCDPDDVERVFRAEGYPSSRGDLLMLATYHEQAKGLLRSFNGDDESWHVHRSAVAPKLLLRGVLKPFFPDLCNVADDTIARFKEGRNLGIEYHLNKLAGESVAVLLFGECIGVNAESPNPSAKDFIKAVNGYFSAEAKLMFSIPLHKYVKTPTLKELYHCLDKQWKITRHFLDKVNQERSPLAKQCLVHRLAKEDKIPQEEVLQICQGLFAGGTHTTASNLLVTLHILSKYPEAQQRMYDEIEAVLPDKQQPTLDQILQMRYVRASLKEAFRIQPSPIGNIRRLQLPVVVGGYEVPPGIMIFLSAVASKSIQKKKYGADFESFRPERWLRGTEDKIHPFASLPFGFGPRMCAGKRFAELEMYIFLVRLLQKYEIVESSHEDDQVEWYFNVVHNPTTPYNLKLKKRM